MFVLICFPHDIRLISSNSSSLLNNKGSASECMRNNTINLKNLYITTPERRDLHSTPSGKTLTQT